MTPSPYLELLDWRRQVSELFTALRAYSDRGRAAQLIAPGGLGDFLVLGLGVNVDPRRVPQSMRGDLS